MAIAHTRNANGVRQGLSDHLYAVAEAAATFAAPFGGQALAYRAGLLHDIGKFNPAFQQYLIEAEANPKTRQRGPDHKGAGTVLAAQQGDDLLTFLVSGHHGGLLALNGANTTQKGLNEWLRERAADPDVHAAIASARGALPELATPHRLSLPDDVRDELTREFFVRMLFSALVDADFLDTERHFAPGKAARRGKPCSLADLEARFSADQQATMDRAERQAPGDPVNALRRDVYQWCLAAAELPPGFFRLSVPTGGGKTRSSLGFALRHAATHGHRRIIYAIPYTSITEQTADEFRAIFADCGDGSVPLEHHSAIAPPDPDAPTSREVHARLAAENWDAPLVVTTTVQLFESLMARSTSACRKLHHIAGSVIILDEAQALPAELLDPILDALRQLVAQYGVTVVLCTATQPALDPDQATGFAGLPYMREIVPEPQRLFAALARVAYRLPTAGERWSWERVAEVMRTKRQVLAIVNTRAHAVTLLDALGDPDALHLSTWMCGAHRRDVLAEARRRLAANEPCRLLSTQLIEAGVDIDFPLVLRAMGPLDSIVQAAGRCNRNGRLGEPGQVIVFVPEAAALPHGSYRIGTEVATQELARAGINLHDPETYRRYFRRFYDRIDLDAKKIQASRAALDYPRVAEDFQMIADETVPVVVTHYQIGGHADKAEALLDRLRQEPWRARLHLRALQPYLVALRRHQIEPIVARGSAEEIAEMPGLYRWRGQYDPAHGIDLASDPDAAASLW
jgi:CRISPR-associated endonuclease/helicase Cas3